MVDPRRRVPRTDAVLADPRLVDAVARLGPDLVKAAVTGAQQRVRDGDLAPEAVADAAHAALPRSATGLRPVINATGVLLHTNLGRAPLSAAARAAVDLAAGVCDVELDLTTGERGRRGAGAIGALLAAVPEAPAAHLVNNGAAALALVATALAAGREMVIARGELVEIGDGFRIPDLLEATGARLREVGTTNRVTRDDYAAAIGPDTALVLKIHPSNFTISGFTRSCGVGELAGLGVPVVADIGSGLLAPHPLLPDEPAAATALREGAALVTASGDKLLGGPQAGLILGDADLVQRLRRHPLARALRVDKLTLAAVEATLRGPRPPVAEFLAADVADLRRRAEAIAATLRDGYRECADIAAAAVPARGQDAQLGGPDRATRGSEHPDSRVENARLAGTGSPTRGVEVDVVESEATVGGGGAPGVTLPSVALALPARLAAALRTGTPAVLGRVERGRCLLDLRAVPPEQDAELAAAIRTCMS